ncbi:phospholipase A2 inhibitor 25 kDa subunit-like isoform X2 [Pelobates fuscus]|uniref:phospholipase A2 inhibitor 25 kDa subunit-like isoform X2 n=1 Tax=Pelobates fuscus TaxID=191477 RepID=UPI002FE4CC17
MNSLIGILGVLSVLVSTGDSLSCIKCLGSSNATCIGSSVTCPSDNICVNGYSLTNAAGTITPSFNRDCGPRNQCNLTGSVTFNIGLVRVATTCCSTDNCDPGIPTLPSNNNQQNGLTCRTCYSGNSLSCYTSETIQCKGVENKCFLLEKKLSGTFYSKEALRGCATDTYCSLLGTQTASYDGLNIDMKVFCTSGTNSLHGGFFLSTAAFLVVLKYLFL